MTRQECVVLLTLGVQGIMEKRTDNTRLFGQEFLQVPWSARASFIQYNFSAQLGFDGTDVEIEELGENRYRVSIPEFEFIGHDDA